MKASVSTLTVADLLLVEQYLRRVFNTQDGQACQHLLTSSYQLWLTQVKTVLRKPLCERVQLIETYLPNYHIYFLKNTVYIDFISPCIPKLEKHEKTPKRKRVSTSPSRRKHAAAL